MEKVIYENPFSKLTAKIDGDVIELIQEVNIDDSEIKGTVANQIHMFAEELEELVEFVKDSQQKSS